jgi:ribosome maturation factor RimP
MDRTAEIERLVEPSLDAMGYELVRVRVTGGGRSTLQIMAERKDRLEMTVENCAEISRNLSALLDVEDPIPEAYALEVSSPGIDRPLVRLQDYERFAGFEARIETKRPHDGRRKFTGRLAGVRDERVAIGGETGEAEIPFDEIERANLVLTDELIAASMNHRDG